MTELELLQVRCKEAELALEKCQAIFELIPIRSLELQQTWIPSDVAIMLLKKAKGAVSNYIETHPDTTSDD